MKMTFLAKQVTFYLLPSIPPSRPLPPFLSRLIILSFLSCYRARRGFSFRNLHFPRQKKTFQQGNSQNLSPIIRNKRLRCLPLCRKSLFKHYRTCGSIFLLPFFIDSSFFLLFPPPFLEDNNIKAFSHGAFKKGTGIKKLC